jgi:hypothetical protein
MQRAIGQRLPVSQRMQKVVEAVLQLIPRKHLLLEIILMQRDKKQLQAEAQLTLRDIIRPLLVCSLTQKA